LRIQVIRVSCLVLALVLFGLAAPAVQNQNLPILKKNVPTLCSDIVSHLVVQKNPDGTVVLTGRVCNDGPGGYSNPTGALDAYFMVYTWHPPKTPAQEGDLKFYQHTDLGTALKFRDCKSITYMYKIDKFSRWGSFPASATERPAMKQFCVQVQKKGPIGFSPCEDSNNTNTTACQDVAYMEKI
jgi:hypothetical protein